MELRLGKVNLSPLPDISTFAYGMNFETLDQ